MIDYDLGYLGAGFAFQRRGSVFAKALFWALPSTCLAMLLHASLRVLEVNFDYDDPGIPIGFACFSLVLGFMLLFRIHYAYARWWQGGTQLQVMRGEWLSAFSGFLAFASRDPARKDDVDRFRHAMVRLMSLLHGAALRQLSLSQVAEFEIIDLQAVGERGIDALLDCKPGCEVAVVYQWIQRAAIDAMEDGTMSAPVPLLSKSFQSLSDGMVKLAEAQAVSDMPFPFPCAQLLSMALMIQTVLMPVVLAFLCRATWWVGVLNFAMLMCVWGMNYCAQEIESPFGNDANGLPLREMQLLFNNVLATLMTRGSETPPGLSVGTDARRPVRAAAVEASTTSGSLWQSTSSPPPEVESPTGEALGPERRLSLCRAGEGGEGLHHMRPRKRLSLFSESQDLVKRDDPLFSLFTGSQELGRKVDPWPGGAVLPDAGAPAKGVDKPEPAMVASGQPLVLATWQEIDPLQQLTKVTFDVRATHSC